MCFRILVIAALFVTATVSARVEADIYRWHDGQVIPGTEGITPGPGVVLDHRELSFVSLEGLDLTGSRFEFSNLANARFTFYTGGDHYGSNLTGANLSGTTLIRADLIGSTLISSNLSDANLAGARLYFSDLSNANLTGAVVTGTNLRYTTGFTKEQLYSTASYQAKNLQGIKLMGYDLSGWDFSGQNLTNAGSEPVCKTSCGFYTSLAGADLTGADTRGARGFNLTGAKSDNAILQDGHILGLNLALGDKLVVPPLSSCH
jgi:uncharacterized protein YjbI with pentapeptide repeats